MIFKNQLPTAVSTVTTHKSRRVTIVGGKGRMGQFFAKQLTLAGHYVEILGREDWKKADLLLAEAELVLISVPIEQTLTIIEQISKYIAPTTAIADITSIKTEPVAKMLACHEGAVMGLHPMFGPNQNSFNAQKIVVCPGRQDSAFQWLIDLMASKGSDLIFCQPQEHDRTMAIVQAVRHFSQFGFGLFLASNRVDLERSLSMASPNYLLEYEAVKRFFQQNPSMYVDIMLASETSRQTITSLAETYQYLADLVAKNDRESLIKTFLATQNLWKNRS
jgi:prephenate dehydrogenase